MIVYDVEDEIETNPDYVKENDMSETKTDVASSPVSTLFSLDPICFDVVKANEHLDSITSCSEYEDFIDRIEEFIDNVKKDSRSFRRHSEAPFN
ncbi:hypothetical protein TNCV_1238301 [Trichonephila clavipes]|nr:hypothetical protein TNCV_1238301 [Trichonephila clavipes]